MALCDADHEHHGRATAWFRRHRRQEWATGPLTENGLLRVLGHPSYPGGPGSLEGVRPLLRHLRAVAGHQFWPDTISLADALPTLGGITPRRLTDVYLLALAVQRAARLATLDSRIDATRVPGGPQALVLVS